MNYYLNVLNFVNSVHIFSEVTPYVFMYLFFRNRSVLPLYFDVCVVGVFLPQDLWNKLTLRLKFFKSTDRRQKGG